MRFFCCNRCSAVLNRVEIATALLRSLAMTICKPRNDNHWLSLVKETPLSGEMDEAQMGRLVPARELSLVGVPEKPLLFGERRSGEAIQEWSSLSNKRSP